MSTARNKLVPIAFVAVAIAMAQQKPPGNPDVGGPETATRFTGTMMLRTSKGTNVPLHVDLKEWYLTRDDRGTEVSVQGFYMACLRSGDLITQVGGKSQTRHSGDCWIVDKGTRMSVLIKRPREAAVLQTLAVSPAH